MEGDYLAEEASKARFFCFGVIGTAGCIGIDGCIRREDGWDLLRMLKSRMCFSDQVGDGVVIDG